MVYIDEFDRLDEHLKDTLQEFLNMYARGGTIRSIRLTKPTILSEFEIIFKNLAHIQALLQKEVARIEADQTKKI